MQLNEHFIDDTSAVLGCMRADKKINVFFIPLYKQYYVRSEEWSGWTLFETWSRGRLPLSNSKGVWYTHVNVSYTGQDGKFRQFTFSPLKPDWQIFQNEAYEYVFPQFSLRAGKYKFRITSQIYEDLLEYLKKPVKETFYDELEVVVPEEGDVPLFLCAGVSIEYEKFEKFDDILWRWETKREVVNRNFQHNFMQLSPEQANKIYKFWKTESDKMEVIPQGEPWGFESPKARKTTTTKSSSSKTKTEKVVKTEKPVKSEYDKQGDALKINSTRSELFISDTYGAKGLFNGAQIWAKPNGSAESISLKESQNLGLESKMKAEISTDGIMSFYLENKKGRVGGKVETNNRGGVFYSYLDSYGVNQRYCISVNPSDIEVYEVKDGYLTGKAYSITVDDVCEARTNRYKIVGENRLIAPPLYARFPFEKIDIPSALTGKSVYINQNPNKYSLSQYVGNDINGYGLFNADYFYMGSMNKVGPHGVGCLRNSNGDINMGGFRNGEPHGLNYMIKDGVEYICSYNGGRINGMFLELRSDRVILTKYDYPGKITDRSVVIYCGERGFGFYNSLDRSGALENIPRVYHQGGGTRTVL